MNDLSKETSERDPQKRQGEREYRQFLLQAVEEAKRSDKDLYLITMDISGAQIKDEALISLGGQLIKVFGESTPTRPFQSRQSIILPDVTIDTALKFSLAFLKEAPKLVPSSLRPGISVGVATFDRTIDEAANLELKAKKGLDEAIKSGRDKIGVVVNRGQELPPLYELSDDERDSIILIHI